MMPSCDQTGVPIHFHSSTTSGSACLMSLRILPSVFPRQSASSAILFEMSSDADSLWPAPDFFILSSLRCSGKGRRYCLAGQAAYAAHSNPRRRPHAAALPWHPADEKYEGNTMPKSIMRATAIALTALIATVAFAAERKIPQTMKAIRTDPAGPRGALKLETVPVPRPAEGQVL